MGDTYKIIKIKSCDECPWFDWVLGQKSPTCRKVNRRLEVYGSCIDFPVWCPLNGHIEDGIRYDILLS
jgi:hypothetical protein